MALARKKTKVGLKVKTKAKGCSSKKSSVACKTKTGKCATKKQPAKKVLSKKCQTKKIDSEKLNQMIQERAYFIWQEQSRPQNCDSQIHKSAQNESRIVFLKNHRAQQLIFPVKHQILKPKLDLLKLSEKWSDALR